MTDAKDLDLYGHLGIPREATDFAIRQAYRRKSKSTHPDAGGSPEEFAITRTALAVLTDPKRRAEYDRTGKISDAPIDNTHAAYAEIICGLFDQACAAGAKSRLEPHQFDVIDAMRELCKNNLDGLAQQKRDLERKLKTAESMGGRFKHKKRRKKDEAPAAEAPSDGDNLLDRLMRGRCEPFRQALRQNAEITEKFTAVKEILAEYDFKFDEPTASATHSFFVQMR